MLRKGIVMRHLLCIALLLTQSLPLLAEPSSDEAGFVSMFNGKDLSGWEGKAGLWWIEDGVITAESSPDKPCERAHYLYWKGGQPEDFILRFEYKILGKGGNSGVHFRSEERPDFDIWGYQADIENGPQWTGCLFQHDRGGVVMRGFKAAIDKQGKREETQFTDPDALQKCVKSDDWNAYEVEAKGNHILLRINGTLMCEVEDNDATYSRSKGHVALQMHPGPPMKIQFRNLRIKELQKDGK
jgi:hypothetical protein